MLESPPLQSLTARWKALPSRTKLPFPWKLFVQQPEAAWHYPNCRRRGGRSSLRTIAILVHAGTLHAAYTRDISDQGIGFFAPLQLYPGEQTWIELPGGRVVPLVVVHSKRLNDRCYRCGATYASSQATD